MLFIQNYLFRFKEERERMNLNLPKKPEGDIMKMLIRANQFLEHAKTHAQNGSDFDIMIAIHNLDNAIEYMLRILILHLEIEETTGKTIVTCELAQLIGEVEKFLRDNSAPQLSYVPQLKMIRELRNMVQHAMINPVSEAMTYLNYGEKFFERSLTKYFGLSKAELRFSTLLTNDVLKAKLKCSEEKIDEGKFLEAVVECRDAFDYARFIYTSKFSGRIWNAPAFTEIKASYSNLYKMLDDMNESIKLNSLNINMSKYSHYCEYIRCIPREYQADWSSNTVLQREWNKQDAEFCYLFVANALLDWQTNHMEPIQSIGDGEHAFYFSEKICGVETKEHFTRKCCTYALENQMAELFYVPTKENLEALKAGALKGIVYRESKRWFLENLQIHYTELIQITNYDYRFVMNSPATWEVVIFYEDIPFTKRSLLNDSFIDIDGELGEELEETTQDIIREYVPLKSVEKAKELLAKLQEINSKHVNEMYSSVLVNNLVKAE